jgi:hypothetical protein
MHNDGLICLCSFVVTARHCVSWEETGDVVEVNMVAVWLGSHAKQVRRKKLKLSRDSLTGWIFVWQKRSSEFPYSSLAIYSSFYTPLDAEKYTAPLQMKSRWETNINVWFPFMYSQNWNCAASLFPKQNYNVLSPNSYTHILYTLSVRDLYISRISLSILLQPNMWTNI